MDYHYGRSQYSSSASPRPEDYRKSTEAAPAPKSKFRRIPKIIALICAFLLFVVWIWLGDFRFMLGRAPGFAGFPFGSRTYLVLFQNNYELRPTGGFISTYGELSFQSGFYKGIEFHDVYGDIDKHETIEPPLVLATLLKDPNYKGHSFRDANFNPDFPSSAQDLITFYKLTNPDARVDGVIAVDFTFLENWLALFEPLKIDDLTLTQQNLFETLSSVVSDIDHHDEAALATRKDSASTIAKTLLNRTLYRPWNWTPFKQLILTGLQEKHVIASFNRSGMKSSFAKRNWDGALVSPDQGDFLAVNEGNYGGMKSNRYLFKEVTYEITITDQMDLRGNPIVTGKLTVEMSHQGIVNPPLSGPYSGYIRSFIPLGSDIIKSGTVQEPNDLFDVLADMVKIQPSETLTLSYEYQLPESVWNDGLYALHIQKQPGTLADHYRVFVRAPQGMSFDSSDFNVRENLAYLDIDLLTDENVSFRLTPDTNPPRVVSHEITALNEVTLLFNEPLSQASARNLESYALTDMNVKNSEMTDQLPLQSIRQDGAKVILTFAGMTDQPEERYELVVQNLEDLHGNIISENPRTLTVVQRLNGETTPTPIVEEVLTEETPTEEVLNPPAE